MRAVATIRRPIAAFCFLAGLLTISSAGAQSLQQVFSFPGSGLGRPMGQLVRASDGNLYGTTYFGREPGSARNAGSVFRLTAAGEFTVLHVFRGTDGSNPGTALIQAADGFLYGTTASGGAYDAGTIFRMSLGGTLTTLHSFGGAPNAAAQPSTALVQAADGSFYGGTYRGGLGDHGTLYRLSSAGLSVVIAIDGQLGQTPSGLTMGRDGAIYGTAASGGWFGGGTFFKLTTSGLFTRLYSFGFGEKDASAPRGLIEGRDGLFYGTGAGGGKFGHGAVFSLTRDGTLSLLHSFAGGSDDGADPESALVGLSDGDFVGSTYSGGPADKGTLFRLAPGGGSYALLHAFTGGEGGGEPWVAPVEGPGGLLYGVTSRGGAYHHPAYQAGDGTVFSLSAAGTFAVLQSFLQVGGSPGPLLRVPDGTFYGITTWGGAWGRGDVFRMTPSGVVTTLHQFTGESGDGAMPVPELVQGPDGSVLGMTQFGGASDVGTIFRISPDGAYLQLHSFEGGARGGRPVVGLTWGPSDDPTLGFYGLAGDVFFSFSEQRGYVPIRENAGYSKGRLVLARDGDFYGTTRTSVFRLSRTGELTTVTTSVGSDAALVSAGGFLYGTTFYTEGGIFQLTTAGDVTLLHEWTHQPGEPAAYSALVEGRDGSFYATTGGGANYLGTIVRVTPGGVVSILHEFSGLADGTQPFAALVEADPGIFYGTTSGGGSSDVGSIFRLDVNGATEPFVTTQPSALTVNPGQTATFTVGFGGTPAPRVQWQISIDGGSSFADIVGAVDTVHSFTALASNDGYRFRAVGTNTGGSVASESALLTVKTTSPWMSIDGPAANARVRQPFLTGGWAVDLGAVTGVGVDAVHVWAFPVVNGVTDTTHGIFVAEGAVGGIRSDVAAIWGPQFAGCGFTFVIQGLESGTYDLGVYARSTVTSTFNDVKFARITIAPSTEPRMSIDGPAPNAMVRQPFLAGGWAVDLAAASGSGVDAVHVWAFPVVNGAVDTSHGVFVAAGEGGGLRLDVGAVFGEQFNDSGFTFVVQGLPTGMYELGVYARSAVTSTFNDVTFVRITISVTATDARMAIDGPPPNAVVQQPFITGGWAVDLGAASGSGVDAVHAWAFPVVDDVTDTAHGVFVAEGAGGGSRPDVGAVFGSQFNACGFTFIIDGLAPGTYELGVYARSTVTRTFNDVRFVRIVIPARAAAKRTPR